MDLLNGHIKIMLSVHANLTKFSIWIKVFNMDHDGNISLILSDIIHSMHHTIGNSI